ncbi:hypothetical protein ACOXXX_08255 [Thalassococcus sp. BH17M4-6]|uniref:hypothetical protein n=1 Tax=Thalassococcus sp. BH17M4-6 TaxID=3413148 RepID=UPI003BD0DC48
MSNLRGVTPGFGDGEDENSGDDPAGETYYPNVKTPKSHRAHYRGKEDLRESLRRSDPATATARPEIIRATRRADREHDDRRKDLDRLVQALRPKDRTIFKAAGGLEGLLRRFEAGQVARRFVEAAAPVRLPDDDEDDREDDVLEADLAAHRAHQFFEEIDLGRQLFAARRTAHRGNTGHA